MSLVKVRRALISASDREGLEAFARGLAEHGIDLLATTGTASYLRAKGIAVREVSEYTGAPEMLGGRVKTLHPAIHAGILYRRGHPEHEETLAQHGYQPIDLVAVTLYPFETLLLREAPTAEIIENIDVGGAALLRAAAKNHAYVAAVADACDYERVLQDLHNNNGSTSLELRRELAGKAFARLAQYDAAVARFLAQQTPSVAPPLIVTTCDVLRLRYGENPHQEGLFYRDPDPHTACVAWSVQLHGKEMSFNNYLDADAALCAVREQCGIPAAVIVKHTNPCGFATGSTLEKALSAAWDGDPVSAFGGVVAVTTPFTAEAARVLKDRFVEVIVAPAYEPEALELLRAKSRDLRLLKLHRPLTPPAPDRQVRQIHGGWLVQNRDVTEMEQWIIPTEVIFPEEKRALAEFGIRVCTHLKSNAVAIVWEYEPGQFMLLGAGAGQPNRVDALRRLAIPRARENCRRLAEKRMPYGQTASDFEREVLKECVLVSDGFFPFPDSIEAAAEAGLRYIVQPGGSRRDEEVIAACDRYGIAMAVTGVRHFLH